MPLTMCEPPQRSKEDVKALLKAWPSLYTRKLKLVERIAACEARIKELNSIGAIQSSIIQRYEGMDMPRGTDVTDRTGEWVARVMDDTATEQLRLADLKRQWLNVAGTLDDIESAVSMLREDIQQAIRLRYFHHTKWMEACNIMHVGKTLYYELVEAGEKALEHFE